MKRIFYLLFSVLVLISCKSRNELEGLWMGAYQIHYSGDDPKLSSVRLLLDISKDAIVYKTFDYPMFDEIDSMIILKYSIIDNKLILDNDTFLIKGITKDSLVLSINSDYKWEIIFKWLSENNE